jgi:heme/copper-type cytochrome/quinol oxidase subunit 2
MGHSLWYNWKRASDTIVNFFSDLGPVIALALPGRTIQRESMRVFLTTAIFWLAALSSAAAQVMILRSAIVSTPRPAASQASWPTLRRALEIAWAGLPGIALVVLFLFTWRAMHAASPIAPR